MFNKTIWAITLWFALALTNIAFAHSAVVFSSPANNSQLSEAPDAIHLEFNEDVRLLALELSGMEQGDVVIDFQRDRQAKDVFHINLPDLADDIYTITWTLIGADGHRVSGDIVFTLSSAG
ncbi:uncharacterized protein, copper resistance protein CopC-like protein [Idiomarina sp. A28L]|uniref:copper resistance CopC family protein n=1 Tax=Idiomarina sp. A28L TaxID=1036674 RepID=UPI0002138716|nr:copper resistance CopC family protein [Idiomarina sp. A28L]EGN74800.1 uncharacterized protein, copper resistance protein CopC-like protein [Idiomarina sp. A28L]